MWQVHVIDGETGIVRQIIQCNDEDEAKRRDAAETTQLERTGHYSIIVPPKEVD